MRTEYLANPQRSIVMSPLYLALLLCLLLLMRKAWLKRRREREQSAFPFSEAVLAAAQEKFNAARSSESVKASASDIRATIPNNPGEDQYSPDGANESIVGNTSYAMLLALMAWLWFLAALPFLTDAACQIFVAAILAILWMILAFTWLCGLFMARSLLRSSSAWKWWLSAGLAGLLGLLMAFTDVGFIARVALSDRALSAYVAAVPAGTENTTHSPRLVGLFLVDGTQESDGVVLLYTSTDFLDRHGIAYVPKGVIPPSHLSMKHLFGQWYSFWWHF